MQSPVARATVFPPLIVLFLCPKCNNCVFLPVEKALPPHPRQVPFCQKCLAQLKSVEMLRQDYAIISPVTIG